MASPGGKKVLLFQSPNTSAGEADPLPPHAHHSTDTVQKAEQSRCVCRSAGATRLACRAAAARVHAATARRSGSHAHARARDSRARRVGRKTLLADMLTELRAVSASLDEDAWKFEGEGALS